MLNLGGNIMGFSSADSSSASKGESVSDTIRTISCYADICAMRHPKEGDRKSSYGSLQTFFYSSYQRRRRRTPASDTDTHRPVDDTFPERSSGQYDYRLVRRSEIRTYRPLSDPRTGEIHRYPVCADLSGRIETPKLHTF